MSRLFAFAVLGGCALSLRSAVALGEEKVDSGKRAGRPSPDAAVVAAWRAAGAEFYDSAEVAETNALRPVAIFGSGDPLDEERTSEKPSVARAADLAQHDGFSALASLIAEHDLPTFAFSIEPRPSFRALPPPAIPFAISFAPSSPFGVPPDKGAELRLEGISRFAQVRRVDVGFRRLSKAAAKELALLPNLKFLGLVGFGGLGGNEITDEVIRELAKSPSLEGIDLNGSQGPTDGAVAELARIKTLQGLELHYEPVIDFTTKKVQTRALTDEGLRHLTGLDKLRYLGLSHTGLTDAAFKELAKLPRLEMLDLTWTRVSDEAWDPLESTCRHASLSIL